MYVVRGWPALRSPLAAACRRACDMRTRPATRRSAQYLSSECVTCHQIIGAVRRHPADRRLAGAVFVEIMDEYRAKKRANPVMQTIAGRLSEEEIAALAAYFGSLQPAN